MIKIITNTYTIDKKFFKSRLARITRKLKIKGTITIRLGSLLESHELNLRYLSKDYPTDVLSFPINENLPQGFYLGDIFICYPIAQEQAITFHISPEEELLNLMIHGILHLAGYDHEKDKGEMFELQKKLLHDVKSS